MMVNKLYLDNPYIQNAMRLAKYEILEDGQYYGEIPGFQGVWASSENLEACREELQSVLEDWLNFKTDRRIDDKI